MYNVLIVLAKFKLIVTGQAFLPTAPALVEHDGKKHDMAFLYIHA